MTFPPAILDMRFPRSEGGTTHLWLPLFLLWPLLLAIAVLVLVATIAVDVVLLIAGQRYHHFTLLVIRTMALLCETRGTSVRIHGRETDFDMTLV